MANVSQAEQRFGGVFDLSRSLFLDEPPPTLVCNACQTVNRQSAQYCKGCAGKLPQFYANQRPGAPAPAARPSSSRPARDERSCRALRMPLVRQRLAVRDFNSPAVAVALSIVLLFAAFGYWFTSHALTRPGAPAIALTPQRMAQAAVVAPTLGGEWAAQMPMQRVAVTADEARPAGRPTRVQAVQAPPRRAAPEPVRRLTAVGAVAACNALNFFARAVCLNNRCADAALSRDVACREVHRQQRMAEARRNPSMIN